jgi:hypothetical protein
MRGKRPVAVLQPVLQPGRDDTGRDRTGKDDRTRQRQQNQTPREEAGQGRTPVLCLAVMRSGVRSPAAPLTAKSKASMVVPLPSGDHAGSVTTRDKISGVAHGAGAWLWYPRTGRVTAVCGSGVKAVPPPTAACPAAGPQPSPGVWRSLPRLIARLPIWPAVTRRGLATAHHRLRWGLRRHSRAPDCLSLLTGSVASTPQGERIEQDGGGSTCGAPAPGALARAPLSRTKRLPCSQRSIVSATSLTCHTP